MSTAATWQRRRRAATPPPPRISLIKKRCRNTDPLTPTISTTSTEAMFRPIPTMEEMITTTLSESYRRIRRCDDDDYEGKEPPLRRPRIVSPRRIFMDISHYYYHHQHNQQTDDHHHDDHRHVADSDYTTPKELSSLSSSTADPPPLQYRPPIIYLDDVPDHMEQRRNDSPFFPVF